MTVTNARHRDRRTRPADQQGRRGDAGAATVTPLPAGQPDAVDPVDQVERAVLGGMLTSTSAIDDAIARLTSFHFRDPRHACIFAAITANYAGDAPTDARGVMLTLTDTGDLIRVGGAPYLAELVAGCANPASTGWYADRVARHAAAREVAILGARLSQAGQDADIDRIGKVYEQARELLATDPLDGVSGRPTGTTVDRFLHVEETEDDHDWLIPGLIERGDRVILTGAEGSGKSTFGRQVAVCAAAGIHPFTLEKIDPIRVLILDLENSERQLRRELRPLVIKAGDALDPTNLVIEVRLAGLDLHGGDDRPWLDKLVGTVRPDLIVTGPIYKMANGDPTEEKYAKAVVTCLDQLRERYACALWLEAHSPKAVAGVKRRPIEPYGASLWLRWPEFGIHLATEGDLEHWRGQREHREWPSLFMRGGAWPWTASSTELEVKFRQIKNARFAFGGPMTMRDIEVATAIPKSTVARILRHYAIEWAQFNARTPGEDDV